MLRSPLLIRRLLESYVNGQNMYFPDGRLAFAKKYWRWQWLSRFGPVQTIAAPSRLTAILLSYKRPRNIEPLARMLLRCDFVEKLVICNNNPQVHIHQWVRLSDSRLVLLDNSRNIGTIARFAIARQEAAEYFLAIDDDIFLTPSQIRVLFLRLIEDPSRPHGAYGQNAVSGGSFVDAIHGVDDELDVINRVYAFTREHVAEFYRILELLDFRDATALDGLTAGDDMVLSFSGGARPRCHNVGDILDCPTEGIPGIAVWKEPHFATYRAGLFSRLLALKPLGRA